MVLSDVVADTAAKVPARGEHTGATKAGYLSEVFVSFQGEGAHIGCRHLFVRLAGCNLRCSYCDTPDSLERTAGYAVYDGDGVPTYHANPVSAAEVRNLIAAKLDSDTAIDAVAVTGGEPLAQSEFLAAVLGPNRLPVPVLLETNGVLPRRLPDVLPLIDIVSMDIKLASNAHEGPFWDEHAEFIELARTKDLYVKILVDRSTADGDVEQAVSLLAPLRPRVPAFLQPIVDAANRPLIDGDRLAHFFGLARQQLPTIRVLPQMHKLLGIR